MSEIQGISCATEICNANFSVHAQEPPESIKGMTLSFIPPISDGRFLTNNQKPMELMHIRCK